MRQQLDHIRAAYGSEVHISIVVGFKKDLVMEAAADDAAFVYNELYDQTNTAKSLLKALRFGPPGGVLWLNGDVVFTPDLLGELEPAITAQQSFVAVNTASVAEEEVKYTLDEAGYIECLSKQVSNGLGEAVGINYVAASDRSVLMDHLVLADERDYFERGIESAIAAGGLRVQAVDISKYGCVEVDFAEDLERANALTTTSTNARTTEPSVTPSLSGEHSS